jgi:hypothetical protein
MFWDFRAAIDHVNRLGLLASAHHGHAIEFVQTFSWRYYARPESDLPMWTYGGSRRDGEGVWQGSSPLPSYVPPVEPNPHTLDVLEDGAPLNLYDAGRPRHKRTALVREFMSLRIFEAALDREDVLF